jgi:hypothetical protein
VSRGLVQISQTGEPASSHPNDGSVSKLNPRFTVPLLVYFHRRLGEKTLGFTFRLGQPGSPDQVCSSNLISLIRGIYIPGFVGRINGIYAHRGMGDSEAHLGDVLGQLPTLHRALKVVPGVQDVLLGIELAGHLGGQPLL